MTETPSVHSPTQLDVLVQNWMIKLESFANAMEESELNFNGHRPYRREFNDERFAFDSLTRGLDSSSIGHQLLDELIIEFRKTGDSIAMAKEVRFKCQDFYESLHSVYKYRNELKARIEAALSQLVECTSNEFLPSGQLSEAIQRLVRRDFPACAMDRIKSMLQANAANYRGNDRVRTALLKNANGCLESLKKELSSKSDYRDILRSAERDREEYLAWLKRPGVFPLRLDGIYLVVPNDAALPPICVRSGIKVAITKTESRNLIACAPSQAALQILLNPFGFHHAVKHCTVSFGVASYIRQRRQRNVYLKIALFVCLLITLPVAVATDSIGLTLAAFAISMLSFNDLVGTLVVRNSPITVFKEKNGEFWLRGFGQPFLKHCVERQQQAEAVL